VSNIQLPVGDWLREYRPGWLRFDLLAGLTASAVVIPKAMAYATIAGLPIEVGLYTALVPMVIYAILGTSRPLSVSTTSTIAILAATALAAVAPGADPGRLLAAASTLAMLVGVFLLLAGILRLGFLANFISDPVLTGFKAGIGVVIIVDQLPKLLGVHFDKVPFFRSLLALAQHVPETSVATLVLAVVTLGVMIGLKRFVPRAPSPIVAVALGITAVAFLGLKEQGVALVGSIPAGLPLPMLPDLSLVGVLWPGALGIALMSFTESIAAGRAFARNDEPRPAPNRELVALGVANIAGGFFRALPAGGGTSQTAVNRQAGARTQIAELVTVAVVVATLLFLAPIISLMPQATLAVVLVVTTAGLLDPKDFRAILRVRRMEFWWALAALAGVVLLGTLNGILVAVAISLLILFYQANHPPVYAMRRKPGTDVYRPASSEHPDDEKFEGLLIVRTEGRMTFASAPRLGNRLWELIDEARPRVLVFDFSAVPDIEYTALRMLTEFERKLGERGIKLWLSALNPGALEAVRRSPLGESLGRQRMFFNLEQAVEAYLSSGRDSAGQSEPLKQEAQE